MPERIDVIVNPISGSGPSRKRVEDICGRLAAMGYAVQQHATTKSGDATAFAAAVPDDARAVLVYGGDGTIREVATSLAGRRVPLYHMPGGNENLFAKAFKMRLSAKAVLRAVQTGRRRDIDLIEVNGATLCVASFGVGFDAEVVHRVTEKRQGTVSDLTYLGPIWQTFKAYRFPILHIEADGESVFSGPGVAFAGNLRTYAAGLPVFRGAIPDDGLMDLVIFPCATRRRLLAHTALTLLRLGRLGRPIRHRARDIRITSDSPLRSQVDGDTGPDAPIHAVLRPGALGVLEAG